MGVVDTTELNNKCGFLTTVLSHKSSQFNLQSQNSTFYVWKFLTYPTLHVKSRLCHKRLKIENSSAAVTVVGAFV